VSHDVSSTWAAYGGSQGGAATWAANEETATCAPELHLLGSVSVAPAADMSDYPAMAANQALNQDQIGAYTWLLIGIERTHRDFNIDDYRRGLAKDTWNVQSGCAGPAAVERNKALAQLTPADLVPATPAAQQRLFGLLTAMALPQHPASAPMLVIYGGQDIFVPPQATRRAIERACALGDTIDVIFQPDRGHADVDTSGYVQWLGERFQGSPHRIPASGCAADRLRRRSR
jgi:pimeloyl-ACP methyl ester carboxylesterase